MAEVEKPEKAQTTAAEAAAQPAETASAAPKKATTKKKSAPKKKAVATKKKAAPKAKTAGKKKITPKAAVGGITSASASKPAPMVKSSAPAPAAPPPSAAPAPTPAPAPTAAPAPAPSPQPTPRPQAMPVQTAAPPAGGLGPLLALWGPLLIVALLIFFVSGDKKVASVAAPSGGTEAGSHQPAGGAPFISSGYVPPAQDEAGPASSAARDYGDQLTGSDAAASTQQAVAAGASIEPGAALSGTGTPVAQPGAHYDVVAVGTAAGPGSKAVNKVVILPSPPAPRVPDQLPTPPATTGGEVISAYPADGVSRPRQHASPDGHPVSISETEAEQALVERIQAPLPPPVPAAPKPPRGMAALIDPWSTSGTGSDEPQADAAPVASTPAEAAPAAPADSQAAESPYYRRWSTDPYGRPLPPRDWGPRPPPWMNAPYQGRSE